MKLLARILLISLLVFSSCRGDREEQEVLENGELWQKLEETNKILADFEREEILDFISRRGWKMEETGTGLRIEIYQKGTGARAAFGNLVTIEYSVMLLNGEVVYSSKDLGNKVFQVGRGGVEAGLEEAILLLNVGDRARLIMPPHLAHGFHGDGDRIPRRATIVYQLKLLSAK